MSKAAKRQRQKEQRRQRVETQLKELRAKRRRRMTINLAIVGAVVVGLTTLVSAQRATRTKPKAECKTEKKAAEAATPIDPPPMSIDESKTYKATLETSEGSIVLELADDTSPCTVNSFVFLARRGFYDGLTFHRVVPGFAIQGGDPKGDGTGGPGYQVIEAPPALTKYAKGTVAMAKAPNDPAGASGSQFFIVPGDAAASLDGTAESPAQYALLGKVLEGIDVLAKIEAVPRGEGAGSETPSRPITIVKVTITET